MLYETKLVLKGFDVSSVLEGAFSDIHIELTEILDDIESNLNRVGDFQYGNTLNPNHSLINDEFNKFIETLDKFDVGASKFVQDSIKKNPNLTWLDLIKLVRETFL